MLLWCWCARGAGAMLFVSSLYLLLVWFQRWQSCGVIVVSDWLRAQRYQNGSKFWDKGGKSGPPLMCTLWYSVLYTLTHLWTDLYTLTHPGIPLHPPWTHLYIHPGTPLSSLSNLEPYIFLWCALVRFNYTYLMYLAFYNSLTQFSMLCFLKLYSKELYYRIGVCPSKNVMFQF